jgi:hypothetical protein
MFGVPVTFTLMEKLPAGANGGGFWDGALFPWLTATTHPAQVYSFLQPTDYGAASRIRVSAGKNAGAVSQDIWVYTHRLCGFWKFDESMVSTTVTDSSPKANHGTLNSPAVREVSFDYYAAGGTDNALKLYGTSGSVTIPHTSTLTFSDLMFTVSAWFQLDPSVSLAAATDIFPIISKWGATNNGFELAVKGGSANGLSFRTMQNGVTTQEVVIDVDARNLIKNGRPHFATFTRDSSGMCQLYLDSTPVGPSIYMGASFSNTSPVMIGSNGTNRFKGQLDDVKLYASPLAGDEILIAYDCDQDGQPDWWEMKYFLTLDGLEDADQDGLANIEEYLNGASPVDADSDDDGLNDGAEVHIHGTSPIDADSDGDGMSDRFEYLEGFDPTVPATEELAINLSIETPLE